MTRQDDFVPRDEALAPNVRFTMHLINLDHDILEQIAHVNCWSPTIAEILGLADVFVSAPKGEHLRHTRESVIFDNQQSGPRSGALASRFVDEIRGLNAQVARIRDGGTQASDVTAAAFYHLRFENIHLLRDGNGRVGRILLALQMRIAAGIDPVEFVSQLNQHQNDYNMVMRTCNQRIMFELMVDLVARICGVVVEDSANVLPASLEPIYPDLKAIAVIRRRKTTGARR